MKVKCIATRINDEQKKMLRVMDNINPICDSRFIIGKEYMVLGISYETSPSYWTTVLYELRDETGICLSVPACLFEIIDPRPSVFWRARHNFPNFTLWPPEFYREFFHDDLSEGKPEIKRVFDIVVDRLTYEFEENSIWEMARLNSKGYKNLRNEARLVAEYGGQAGDWVKVTSDAVRTEKGMMQTHAYRNTKTGEIVEPKLKFQ